MRATLVLLFVLAVGARGWSEAPEGNFRHLSIEGGLSDGHLRTIVQDQRGFLWFGTIDGLNRYDGYEIRVFRHDPENPRSLGANFVRALHVDRKGGLWVATIGGGLNLFDRGPRTSSGTSAIPPIPKASDRTRFVPSGKVGRASSGSRRRTGSIGWTLRDDFATTGTTRTIRIA